MELWTNNDGLDLGYIEAPHLARTMDLNGVYAHALHGEQVRYHAPHHKPDSQFFEKKVRPVVEKIAKAINADKKMGVSFDTSRNPSDYLTFYPTPNGDRVYKYCLEAQFTNKETGKHIGTAFLYLDETHPETGNGTSPHENGINTNTPCLDSYLIFKRRLSGVEKIAEQLVCQAVRNQAEKEQKELEAMPPRRTSSTSPYSSAPSASKLGCGNA